MNGIIKKKSTIYSVFHACKRCCGETMSSKCSSCDTDITNKSESISKPKYTIIRKKINNDDNTITVLESKTASSVIKKLNWEHMHMFGNIIAEKPRHNSIWGPKHKQNKPPIQLIQHIPGIVVKENININNSSALNVNVSHTPFDANLSVLKFPLLNKLKSGSSQSEDAVWEANMLRKHLTDVCGDRRIPSVTSILDKTMPPERVLILERWKQNMIKQLGEEGFKNYKTELFSNGSSLHSSINTLLSSPLGSEVHIEPPNAGHWKSLTSIFPVVSDVKLLEEHVMHPFLLYKGVIDCFAKYRDNFVVIDWKTSQKKKETLSSTYDSPLQIAAYVGALNFDPKFQYLVEKGLLVIAYENGSPANVHLINEINLQSYWNKWLKRLKLYWEMVEKGEL